MYVCQVDSQLGVICMNRVIILDVLRGFSLFGLLLVHLPIFGISDFLISDQFDPKADLLHNTAFLIYYVLCDGRFFPIFAFLFGYGFAIQLAGKVGADPKIFLRRLLGLALIGLLHNFLFFNGDILFSYACIGLFLFFLRKSSDKTLFIIFLIAMFFTLITYYLIGDYKPTQLEVEKHIDSLKQVNKLNFFESVTSRINSAPAIFGFILLFNWPSSVAMLCIGYLLGRKNFFQSKNPFSQIPTWIVFISFIIGLGTGIVVSLHNVFGFSKAVSMGLFGLTAPLLSFIYIFFIQRTQSFLPNLLIFRLLSKVGRMSLTIYLLESISMGILFQAWGFSLFDRFDLFTIMSLSLPMFFAFVMFAEVWFQYFEIGPFEGILRAISYVEFPTWKLKS